MGKDQTVQMVTPGQMKDIISAVVQAIPTNMSFDTAQYWIGKKTNLGDEIRNIFSKLNPLAGFITEWQNFYRNVFGIKADFTNLRIPEKSQGFDRLIIMAQGITPQRIYDKCAELFPVWKWTDENLDKIVTSDRLAKNDAYAVWVRDRVEADEELKNLSANDLKRQNIVGITLEERLVYELKYFKEAGKHLDINNVTLCSGSHYSDGDVPNVYWHAYGKLYVNWDNPGSANGNLRARQAVS